MMEKATSFPGFIPTPGTSPVLLTAIHAGHKVRSELEPMYALPPEERLREEDPFTDRWTAPDRRFGRVVVERSRFECDLNRPRHKAIYRKPEDAWGLTVWRSPLPEEMVCRSLAFHDAFYRKLTALVRSMVLRHPRVVVLDLHSYNYRRGGPDAPPSPLETDPDYNIGTATMTDRQNWSDVVDTVVRRLTESDRCGTAPVVAENLRFGGGYLARFLHETFPRRVGCLSLEVKKFFMDEWTGIPDGDCIDTVGRVIAALAVDVEHVLVRT